MQEKIREQEIQKLFSKRTKSVRQLAYEQDQNYPTRLQMEDSHFICDDIFEDGHTGLFAVFDGHGGTSVVNFTANQMPQIFKQQYKADQKKNMRKVFSDLFRQVDIDLNQFKVNGADESGTCACIALVKQEATITPIPNRVCYVANVGDTRAVLNEDGFGRRISYDHKAKDESEQDRIKKMGGAIFNNRVSGQLAVTRAIGDLDLKKEGVIAEPHVASFEISPKTKYLIMASDGLWDVVSDQESVDLTKNEKNTQLMAKKLLNEAKLRGSKDNIAIMVIQFS